MKYLTSAIAFLFLGACATTGHAMSGADAEVEKAVKALAAAADRQDTDAVQVLLHEKYQALFVVPGAPGESSFDRKTYLELLDQKKIGGDKRKVQVLSIDRHDRLAFVRARMTGSKASFEMQQTFVKTKAGWQLLVETMVFAPKKA